jgi:AraC-like DNA-binding protein
LAAVRISGGVRRLRADADKVEVIALAVGYRSKRAFHRAVRRETGLTPGQVRTAAT